jgi:[ribosomal protein S5]-alanine N-acetyltransferase
VIETERLRLRRLTEADRDTVARWNADAEFARHLGGPHSRERSDEIFDRWARHWAENGFGSLGIEWRATGELIGRTGPAFHPVWPDDPELGWAIDPAWWGRGVATEAGEACIGWAFGPLGFARIVSIATEPNVASLRVMAKLGFTLERRLPSEHGELLLHALERKS